MRFVPTQSRISLLYNNLALEPQTLQEKTLGELFGTEKVQK